MNIDMALKSRSYILDLDRVRLTFGIFFFLSCLMERFFLPAFRIYLFFVVKNTHQKAANLMFCLILPVAKGPWLFLEVQFISRINMDMSVWFLYLCYQYVETYKIFFY